MQSSAVRYHLFSHPHHRHMHTVVPVLAPPNDGSHDCHHLTYGAETSPPCRFDHKSIDVFYQKPRFPRQARVSHLALSDGVNPVVSSADHTRWRVKRQATRTRCVSKHTLIPPLSRHTFTEHSPLSQQPSSMSLDPYNILFDRTPLSLWHCSLTTSYPLTQRTQDPFKC